jgi:hypothetical protein
MPAVYTSILHYSTSPTRVHEVNQNLTNVRFEQDGGWLLLRGLSRGETQTNQRQSVFVTTDVHFLSQVSQLHAIFEENKVFQVAVWC